MEFTLREPVVAGTFYPGSAAQLERELGQLIEVRHDPKAPDAVHLARAALSLPPA